MVSSFFRILLWFIYAKNDLTNGVYNGPAKHVVYVLLDDIGWSDITATGGQFPTPTIDSLYNDGIVLNRHYIHYVCSQSRSQFLTGRRATSFGYGKMTPWGYTRLGAIPIGQPTTANWFRDFVAANPGSDIPKYKTYGIGKWHVGYASSYHTPEYKGHDHYYGFYQTSTDYFDKVFDRGEWPTNGLPTYDFFEDEVPAFSALDGKTNTMFLYGDKIKEYLTAFNAEQAATPGETLSMYLYVGLQTMHGPYSRFRAYTDECTVILSNAGVSLTDNRLRYCEYTLMTEYFMDTMVTDFKNAGLWDDTLLIFTGDNGAGLEAKGCNYPLRGGKASFYDGGIRQLTFVNGGDNVIPAASRGSVRESLISNLDWAPTLLSYAGILPYIDPADYEWDGEDVMNVILHGDSHKVRESLLLTVRSTNINTVDDIDSGAILFEYNGRRGDGHLYKYIIADINGVDAAWGVDKFDGWCSINQSNNNSIYLIPRETSPYATSATVFRSQFMFDLTADIGERYNVQRGKTITGATLRNAAKRRLLTYAKAALTTEIGKSGMTDFYHEPLGCMWQPLAKGSPANFPMNNSVYGDLGLYIMPFLNLTDYLDRIRACFDMFNGTTTSTEIPPGLRDLYLNEWIPPNSVVIPNNHHEHKADGENQLFNDNVEDVEEETVKMMLLQNGYVQIFLVVVLVLFALFCSKFVINTNNNSKKLKGEYQPLLEARVESK